MNDLSKPIVDIRVQRIIDWLMQHHEQIKLLERGKLEINFAGWEQQASIRVALTVHDTA